MRVGVAEKAWGRAARWSLDLSAGAWLGGGERRRPKLGIEVPDGADVWGGHRPEAVLSKDAFTCQDGQVFGIRLPSRGRAEGKFFYLQLNPVEMFYPIQVYFDQSDLRNIFLLIPPELETGIDQWHVMYRRSDKPRGDVWVEQRLFSVGYGHPCGPEGDLEARAAMAATEQQTKGTATASTPIGEAAADGVEAGEYSVRVRRHEAAATHEAAGMSGEEGTTGAEAATAGAEAPASTGTQAVTDAAVEAASVAETTALPKPAPEHADDAAGASASEARSIDTAREAQTGATSVSAPAPAGAEREGLFLRAFRAFRAWQLE